MTDFTIARIQLLLGRIDNLTERVRLLHDDQQQEVRETTDAGARKNSLRACEHCQGANWILDIVRAQLFTDPTVNYNGPSGQVETEQNAEWLSKRFHETAGNLGLNVEDIADAVLTVAENQCFSANAALNEAHVCSMMPS